MAAKATDTVPEANLPPAGARHLSMLAHCSAGRASGSFACGPLGRGPSKTDFIRAVSGIEVCDCTLVQLWGLHRSLYKNTWNENKVRAMSSSETEHDLGFE